VRVNASIVINAGDSIKTTPQSERQGPMGFL
jgi:hypothetical protein